MTQSINIINPNLYMKDKNSFRNNQNIDVPLVWKINLTFESITCFIIKFVNCCTFIDILIRLIETTIQLHEIII